MSNDDRVPLSYDQAVAMLPSGDRIHTFRSTGIAIIGADWPREKLLAAIREYGAELSGASAAGMGHRLVLIDAKGPLFIETVSNDRNTFVNATEEIEDEDGNTRPMTPDERRAWEQR